MSGNDLKILHQSIRARIGLDPGDEISQEALELYLEDPPKDLDPETLRLAHEELTRLSQSSGATGQAPIGPAVAHDTSPHRVADSSVPVDDAVAAGLEEALAELTPDELAEAKAYDPQKAVPFHVENYEKGGYLLGEGKDAKRIYPHQYGRHGLMLIAINSDNEIVYGFVPRTNQRLKHAFKIDKTKRTGRDLEILEEELGRMTFVKPQVNDGIWFVNGYPGLEDVYFIQLWKVGKPGHPNGYPTVYVSSQDPQSIRKFFSEIPDDVDVIDLAVRVLTDEELAKARAFNPSQAMQFIESRLRKYSHKLGKGRGLKIYGHSYSDGMALLGWTSDDQMLIGFVPASKTEVMAALSKPGKQRSPEEKRLLDDELKKIPLVPLEEKEGIWYVKEYPGLGDTVFINYWERSKPGHSGVPAISVPPGFQDEKYFRFFFKTPEAEMRRMGFPFTKAAHETSPHRVADPSAPADDAVAAGLEEALAIFTPEEIAQAKAYDPQKALPVYLDQFEEGGFIIGEGNEAKKIFAIKVNRGMKIIAITSENEILYGFVPARNTRVIRAFLKDKSLRTSRDQEVVEQEISRLPLIKPSLKDGISFFTGYPGIEDVYSILMWTDKGNPHYKAIATRDPINFQKFLFEIPQVLPHDPDEFDDMIQALPEDDLRVIKAYTPSRAMDYYEVLIRDRGHQIGSGKSKIKITGVYQDEGMILLGFTRDNQVRLGLVPANKTEVIAVLEKPKKSRSREEKRLLDAELAKIPLVPFEEKAGVWYVKGYPGLERTYFLSMWDSGVLERPTGNPAIAPKLARYDEGYYRFFFKDPEAEMRKMGIPYIKASPESAEESEGNIENLGDPLSAHKDAGAINPYKPIPPEGVSGLDFRRVHREYPEEPGLEDALLFENQEYGLGLVFFTAPGERDLPKPHIVQFGFYQLGGTEITDLRSLLLKEAFLLKRQDFGPLGPGMAIDYPYGTPSNKPWRAYVYNKDLLKIDLPEPLLDVDKLGGHHLRRLLQMTFGNEQYSVTRDNIRMYETEKRSDGQINVRREGKNFIVTYLIFVEHKEWKVELTYDKNTHPLEVKFIRGDLEIPGQIIPYPSDKPVSPEEEATVRHVFTAVVEGHRVLMCWDQLLNRSLTRDGMVIAQKIIARDEIAENPPVKPIPPEGVSGLGFRRVHREYSEESGLKDVWFFENEEYGFGLALIFEKDERGRASSKIKRSVFYGLEEGTPRNLRSLYLNGIMHGQYRDPQLFETGRILSYFSTEAPDEKKVIWEMIVYSPDFLKADFKEPLKSADFYAEDNEYSVPRLLQAQFGDEQYGDTFEITDFLLDDHSPEKAAKQAQEGGEILYKMVIKDREWKLRVKFGENEEPKTVEFLYSDSESIAGEILLYQEGIRPGIFSNSRGRYLFSAILDGQRVTVGWTHHKKGNITIGGLVTAQEITNLNEIFGSDPLGDTITPESLLKLARINPNHPDLLIIDGSPYLFYEEEKGGTDEIAFVTTDGKVLKVAHFPKKIFIPDNLGEPYRSKALAINKEHGRVMRSIGEVLGSKGKGLTREAREHITGLHYVTLNKNGEGSNISGGSVTEIHTSYKLTAAHLQFTVKTAGETHQNIFYRPSQRAAMESVETDFSAEDPLGDTITPESLLRLAKENPDHPDLFFVGDKPYLFLEQMGYNSTYAMVITTNGEELEFALILKMSHLFRSVEERVSAEHLATYKADETTLEAIKQTLNSQEREVPFSVGVDINTSHFISFNEVGEATYKSSTAHQEFKLLGTRVLMTDLVAGQTIELDPFELPSRSPITLQWYLDLDKTQKGVIVLESPDGDASDDFKFVLFKAGNKVGVLSNFVKGGGRAEELVFNVLDPQEDQFLIDFFRGVIAGEKSIEDLSAGEKQRLVGDWVGLTRVPRGRDTAPLTKGGMLHKKEARLKKFGYQIEGREIVVTEYRSSRSKKVVRTDRFEFAGKRPPAKKIQPLETASSFNGPITPESLLKLARENPNHPDLLIIDNQPYLFLQQQGSNSSMAALITTDGERLEVAVIPKKLPPQDARSRSERSLFKRLQGENSRLVGDIKRKLRGEVKEDDERIEDRVRRLKFIPVNDFGKAHDVFYSYTREIIIKDKTIFVKNITKGEVKEYQLEMTSTSPINTEWVRQLPPSEYLKAGVWSVIFRAEDSFAILVADAVQFPQAELKFHILDPSREGDSSILKMIEGNSADGDEPLNSDQQEVIHEKHTIRDGVVKLTDFGHPSASEIRKGRYGYQIDGQEIVVTDYRSAKGKEVINVRRFHPLKKRVASDSATKKINQLEIPITPEWLAGLKEGDHPDVIMVDGEPRLFFEEIGKSHWAALLKSDGQSFYVTVMPTELDSQNSVIHAAAKLQKRVKSAHQKGLPLPKLYEEAIGDIGFESLNEGGVFEAKDSERTVRWTLKGRQIEVFLQERKISLTEEHTLMLPSEAPINSHWLQNKNSGDPGVIVSQFGPKRNDAEDVQFVIFEAGDQVLLLAKSVDEEIVVYPVNNLPKNNFIQKLTQAFYRGESRLIVTPQELDKSLRDLKETKHISLTKDGIPKTEVTRSGKFVYVIDGTSILVHESAGKKSKKIVNTTRFEIAKQASSSASSNPSLAQNEAHLTEWFEALPINHDDVFYTGYNKWVHFLSRDQNGNLRSGVLILAQDGSELGFAILPEETSKTKGGRLSGLFKQQIEELRTQNFGEFKRIEEGQLVDWLEKEIDIKPLSSPTHTINGLSIEVDLSSAQRGSASTSVIFRPASEVRPILPQSQLPTQPITAEWLASLKEGDHPDLLMVDGRPYLLFISQDSEHDAKAGMLLTLQDGKMLMIPMVFHSLERIESMVRRASTQDDRDEIRERLRLSAVTDLIRSAIRNKTKLSKENIKHLVDIQRTSGMTVGTDGKTVKRLDEGTLTYEITGRTISALMTPISGPEERVLYKLRSEEPILNKEWAQVRDSYDPGVIGLTHPSFSSSSTQMGYRYMVFESNETLGLLQAPEGEEEELLFIWLDPVHEKEIIAMVRRALESKQPYQMNDEEYRQLERFGLRREYWTLTKDGKRTEQEIMMGQFGSRLDGRTVILTEYSPEDPSLIVKQEVFKIVGDYDFAPPVTELRAESGRVERIADIPETGAKDIPFRRVEIEGNLTEAALEDYILYEDAAGRGYGLAFQMRRDDEGQLEEVVERIIVYRTVNNKSPQKYLDLVAYSKEIMVLSEMRDLKGQQALSAATSEKYEIPSSHFLAAVNPGAESKAFPPQEIQVDLKKNIGFPADGLYNPKDVFDAQFEGEVYSMTDFSTGSYKEVDAQIKRRRLLSQTFETSIRGKKYRFTIEINRKNIEQSRVIFEDEEGRQYEGNELVPIPGKGHEGSRSPDTLYLLSADVGGHRLKAVWALDSRTERTRQWLIQDIKIVSASPPKELPEAGARDLDFVRVNPKGFSEESRLNDFWLFENAIYGIGIALRVRTDESGKVLQERAYLYKQGEEDIQTLQDLLKHLSFELPVKEPRPLEGRMFTSQDDDGHDSIRYGFFSREEMKVDILKSAMFSNEHNYVDKLFEAKFENEEYGDFKFDNYEMIESHLTDDKPYLIYSAKLGDETWNFRVDIATKRVFFFQGKTPEEKGFIEGKIINGEWKLPDGSQPYMITALLNGRRVVASYIMTKSGTMTVFSEDGIIISREITNYDQVSESLASRRLIKEVENLNQLTPTQKVESIPVNWPGNTKSAQEFQLLTQAPLPISMKSENGESKTFRELKLRLKRREQKQIVLQLGKDGVECLYDVEYYTVHRAPRIRLKPRDGAPHGDLELVLSDRNGIIAIGIPDNSEIQDYLYHGQNGPSLELTLNEEELKIQGHGDPQSELLVQVVSLLQAVTASPDQELQIITPKEGPWSILVNREEGKEQLLLSLIIELQGIYKGSLETKRTIPSWRRSVRRYPLPLDLQKITDEGEQRSVSLGMIRTTNGEDIYEIESAAIHGEDILKLENGSLHINGQEVEEFPAVIAIGDRLSIRRDTDKGWEDIELRFDGPELTLVSDQVIPLEQQVKPITVVNQIKTLAGEIGEDEVFTLSLTVFEDYRTNEWEVRDLSLSFNIDADSLTKLDLNSHVKPKLVSQPDNIRDGGELVFTYPGLGEIRFQVSLEENDLKVVRIPPDPEDHDEMPDLKKGVIEILSRDHVTTIPIEKVEKPGARLFYIVKPSHLQAFRDWMALMGTPLPMGPRDTDIQIIVDSLPPTASTTGSQTGAGTGAAAGTTPPASAKATARQGGGTAPPSGGGGTGGTPPGGGGGTPAPGGPSPSGPSIRVGRTRFDPVRRNNNGTLPIRSIYLRRPEYRQVLEALKGIGLRAAALDKLTPINLTPAPFSVVSSIQLRAGEVFLPTAATLQWLEQALKKDVTKKDPSPKDETKKDTSPFPEGTQIQQRLEFESDSGLVFSIPVIWIHRHRNPFKLDFDGRFLLDIKGKPVLHNGVPVLASGRRIETYIRGHSLHTRRPIDYTFLSYDQGGFWQFHVNAHDPQSGTYKAFSLSAVIHQDSHVLMALVNTQENFIPGKLTSEEDLTVNHQAHRDQARLELDQHLLNYFRNRANFPTVYHLPQVKPEKVGDNLQLAFVSLNNATQSVTAEITGLYLDPTPTRMDFDPELVLTLETIDHKTGNITTETIRLEHTMGLRDYVVLLMEVLPTGQYGRVFEWNLPLATIAQVRSGQAQPVDRKDLLIEIRNRNLDVIYDPDRRRSQETRNEIVEDRLASSLSFNTVYPIPLIPEDMVEIMVPRDGQIQKVTDPARIRKLLEQYPLHDQMLLPGPATARIQAWIGRREEYMSFLTHSGIVLRIPMFEDDKHSYRYLFDEIADPARGTRGERLLIPNRQRKIKYIPALINSSYSGFDAALLTRFPDLKLMLRDYQDESVVAFQKDFISALDKGEAREGTIILPTGSGKTPVGAGAMAVALIQSFLKGSFKDGDKLVVTTHIIDNIKHLSKTIRSVFGPIFKAIMGRELKISVVAGSGKGSEDFSGDVVIMGIQKVGATRFGLEGKLKTALNGGNIPLTVMDEIHHGEADTWNRTFQSIRKASPKAYMLGLTATPDGKEPNVLYHQTAFPLIQSEVLPNIHLVEVKTNIHLDRISPRNGSADFNPEQLTGLIDTRSRNQLIMEKLELYGVRQEDNPRALAPTKIIAASIQHAVGLGKMYVEYFSQGLKYGKRYQESYPLRTRRVELLEPQIISKNKHKAPSADDIRRALKRKERGEIDTIVIVATGKLTSEARKLVWENRINGNIEAVISVDLWIEGSDEWFLQNLVGGATRSKVRKAQEGGRLLRRGPEEVDYENGLLLQRKQRVVIDIVDIYTRGYLQSYRENYGYQKMIPNDTLWDLAKGQEVKPEPTHFEIPVSVRPNRRSGKGNNDLEMRIELDKDEKLQFDFKEVEYEHAYDGRPDAKGTRKNFGYKIRQIGEEVTLSHKSASVDLREWMEQLQINQPPHDYEVGRVLTGRGSNRTRMHSGEVWNINTHWAPKRTYTLQHIVTRLGTSFVPPSAFFEYQDAKGNKKIYDVYAPRDESALLILQDRETKKFKIMIVDKKGHILVWNRREHLLDFLRHSSSVDFPMMGLAGHEYQSEAKSQSTRRLLIKEDDNSRSYEIKAVLARWIGASERSTAESSGSHLPNVRFAVSMDEDGNLTVEPGSIKEVECEAGTYFPFGEGFEVEITEDKWRDTQTGEWRYGKVRIVFRGKEFEVDKVKKDGTPYKSKLVPYGYLVFDSREELIGEADDFKISKAHYHERKLKSRQLLPSEPNYLLKGAGMLVGLEALILIDETQPLFDEEWIQLVLGKKPGKEVLEQLKTTEARQTDIPVLASILSALEFAGYFEEVGYEGDVFNRSGPDEHVLYNLAKFAVDLRIRPRPSSDHSRRTALPAGSGNGGGSSSGSTQGTGSGNPDGSNAPPSIEGHEGPTNFVAPGMVEGVVSPSFEVYSGSTRIQQDAEFILGNAEVVGSSLVARLSAISLEDDLSLEDQRATSDEIRATLPDDWETTVLESIAQAERKGLTEVIYYLEFASDEEIFELFTDETLLYRNLIEAGYTELASQLGQSDQKLSDHQILQINAAIISGAPVEVTRLVETIVPEVNPTTLPENEMMILGTSQNGVIRSMTPLRVVR